MTHKEEIALDQAAGPGILTITLPSGKEVVIAFPWEYAECASRILNKFVAGEPVAVKLGSIFVVVNPANVACIRYTQGGNWD